MGMIERVAKAIWDAWQSSGRRIGPDWNLADPYERQRAIEAARAAIEAMREPTEAMTRSGYYDATHSIESVGDLCSVQAEDQPAEIWRTMIDAALKP